jgi:hypothetical protein
MLTVSVFPLRVPVIVRLPPSGGGTRVNVAVTCPLTLTMPAIFNVNDSPDAGTVKVAFPLKLLPD